MSIQSRLRFKYNKISIFLWSLLTSILITDKRDVSIRDKLYVWVPVWGEQHISMFFRYVLPSMMQSNNLPKVTISKEVTIFIYTVEKNKYYVEQHINSDYKNIKFIIKIENDIHKVVADRITNFFIDILKISVTDKALVLVSMPDSIFSENTVSNLVSLSDGKGVSIAVAHARVSYECSVDSWLNDSELFNGKLNSELLVEYAMKCMHDTLKYADDMEDNNATLDGLSTRRLNNNNLAVIHNLPGPYLLTPIDDDINFFIRRGSFNMIDKLWSHMLLRQSRLKIIGSSDLAFIVELTKGEEKKVSLKSGMKFNDKYSGISPFCGIMNSLVCSWRKK